MMQNGNRRQFLAASAVAATALASGALTRAGDSSDGSQRMIFELRTYHFADAEKQATYEKFLAEAGVAAFNRAGIEPVGIFKPTASAKGEAPTSPTDLIVLLPHKSIDSVYALPGKLQADEAYLRAGGALLTPPKGNPAFSRFESMLVRGFEGFPGIKVSIKSAGRVFELRTYESPSDERALNKIEMFNKGEFPIFDRVGMPGIFFGNAIAGGNLPQLTYMIAHQDMAAVKKDWAGFFADSEWTKLKGDASYKDNVSKVIDTFLTPAAGSQV